MDKSRTETDMPPVGFDVTCLVGTVTFGSGGQTPNEAAFALIARHNADGVFMFPHKDGSDIYVTVEGLGGRS